MGRHCFVISDIFLTTERCAEAKYSTDITFVPFDELGFHWYGYWVDLVTLSKCNI